MPNRLANETSPYLLQHRENPVDWYPWGEEALGRAQAEDRPLLVSIGYSACHWCHVMERESFEDPETATFMNENFVCIKIDREERPDVDALYMEAVQGMTGQGGWPLTVFCDPDQVPFHGGTYFPPEPRQGMPSFRQVMDAVLEAWQTRRDEIEERGKGVREQLGAVGRMEAPEGELDPGSLDQAVEGLAAQTDTRHGGFGRAPKFPPASVLEFLMMGGVTEPVQLTLDAMACGGIYDQLGGGFARYSVDDRWLVPHFEKMLYDNALLARTYLHGYQVLGHELYRRVTTETLDWALNEMRGPEGGFYSALDADSEGEEGRFYVWSEAEVREVLGADADPVIEYYGISEGGNFEGQNILHLPGGPQAKPPAGVEAARASLLERRAGRIRPGLDDKRLCAWNALMIAALADAGAALGEQRYIDAAVACAEFVEHQMRDERGHLLRSYKDGEARLNAYLEDHAFMVEALLALYEATFDVRWFASARSTADQMIERYLDADHGGFFTTSDDHEQLIARRKDLEDHPIPSGNSSAALGLLRLAALTGEHDFERHAVGVLQLLHRPATRHPQAFGHLLQALAFYFSPTREVALIGQASELPALRSELSELAEVVQRVYRPTVVLAAGAAGSDTPELLRDRVAMDGRPAAYVCEQFACKAPVTDPGDLATALD